MTATTSTSFVSACADGTDWRDTSKSVLQQLEHTRHDGFNFGILYVSDHLSDDVTSILNLFRSVLDIEHWIGCIGVGVIGCGTSHVDKPAISAMICRFNDDDFCVFPSTTQEEENPESYGHPSDQSQVTQWLLAHHPIFGIIHMDPFTQENPVTVLEDLSNTTGVFFVGGMVASRKDTLHIANHVFEDSLSGVFFDSDVGVSTMVAQGCREISAIHTVTKCDENLILTLDGRPALDVLKEDIRKNSQQKNRPLPLTHTLSNSEESEYEKAVLPMLKNTLGDNIHAGILVSESDRQDFVVRNIIGVDHDEKALSIAAHITTGERLVFTERSHQSMKEDLSAELVKLRKRVQSERGNFDPKGALYVSCIARNVNSDTRNGQEEIDLIRDVIGDVPMTGFYAGGEISAGRIYGYTGILTLFF